MKLASLFGLGVILALMGRPGLAQVMVAQPNYDVSIVNGTIAATGESMASDRHGNVFVVDRPNAGSHTVTRVGPGGNLTPGFLSGVGIIGQLTTNPVNGLVYVVERSPFILVILCNVWVLDPANGPSLVASFDVNGDGFTIDNAGRYHFGGIGINGQGVYSASPPFNAFVNTTTFASPGTGTNSQLAALVNDISANDILIADGFQVTRLPFGSSTPLPYGSYPCFPNCFSQVVSITRMPFNELGAGAMIGVDQFDTFSISHQGRGIPGDLTSGSNAAFIQENFPPSLTNATTRLKSLAFGYKQSLYWLSDQAVSPIGGPVRKLVRIRQLPAPNVQGSLIASTPPGLVTLDLFGRPMSNAPFTLYGKVGPVLSTGGAFVSLVGCIPLSPFDPGIFPIVDGLGAYGPPSPIGVIPPSGHFSVSFAVPPIGPFNLQILTEALILDFDQCPNGLVFVSNVDSFSI